MGNKALHTETPATAFLKANKVGFTEHVFEYKEHGGTAWSSEAMGVDEHQVVKTLVFENQDAKPLIVLMHGDRKVSTKNLARQTGMKSIQPCKPEVAQRHSGYLVGGTSPFGLRKAMPVFVEETVLALKRIYINGGARGYLVGIDPADLKHTLNPTAVQCALVE
jgi:Cys-tRNA(Pro) deacylase